MQLASNRPLEVVASVAPSVPATLAMMPSASRGKQQGFNLRWQVPAFGTAACLHCSKPRRVWGKARTGTRGCLAASAAIQQQQQQQQKGKGIWQEYGFVYIPNLLGDADFRAVVEEFEASRRYLVDEGPCFAQGRTAMLAPAGGAVEHTFASTDVAERLLQAGVEPSIEVALDLPIEYREYNVGSTMLWHRDPVLSDPPQLELVYTITNSSDSMTEWVPGYLELGRGERHALWTAPNSALLVRAGGPLHMVRAVTIGTRAIAKVVFLHKSARRIREDWDRVLELQRVMHHYSMCAGATHQHTQ